MFPKYTLEKIRFGTDGPTFEKAVAIYESGKVTKFQEGIGAYSAVIQGSKPYRVSVEARQYDMGHCECYLGQNNTLCKHLVALAIMAVQQGKPLAGIDKELFENPISSNRPGELGRGELRGIKKEITKTMRYIKPYEGPSRTWFKYQDSLSEGCRRLSAIVSELPVSVQTTRLLVDLLLRLDSKLCRGGIDDSDGTVGGFMQDTVGVLQEYAKLNSKCISVFQVLEGRETCFGWEEPLVKMVVSKT